MVGFNFADKDPAEPGNAYFTEAELEKIKRSDSTVYSEAGRSYGRAVLEYSLEHGVRADVTEGIEALLDTVEPRDKLVTPGQLFSRIRHAESLLTGAMQGAKERGNAITFMAAADTLLRVIDENRPELQAEARRQQMEAFNRLTEAVEAINSKQGARE